LALQRLRHREPDCEICLVDHDPQKFAFIEAGQAVGTVTATAAAFLTDVLAAGAWPDWIVPAIPRHVAWEWLQRQPPVGQVWRRRPVPKAVGLNLPFVLRGEAGEVYLSLSTRRCPDDCPEPAEKCYLTGAPRDFNLYDYLANISLQDYSSLVIRSRQLAPGVGGYRPSALWQLHRQMLAADGNVLISTACRCHGVSQALEKLTGTEAVVGI
jgi:hypothetical protein